MIGRDWMNGWTYERMNGMIEREEMIGRDWKPRWERLVDSEKTSEADLNFFSSEIVIYFFFSFDLIFSFLHDDFSPAVVKDRCRWGIFFYLFLIFSFKSFYWRFRERWAIRQETRRSGVRAVVHSHLRLSLPCVVSLQACKPLLHFSWKRCTALSARMQ